MSLVLNIDTALEIASVSIAKDGEILSQKINDRQQEHAAWLHYAVQKMLDSTSIELNNFAAIAVVSGPGSYTGLRVGMAAAKGFCYTTGIPLIAINTLELMAFAISENNKVNNTADGDALVFCPMIDARRMEVFTALYDNELREIRAPAAVILKDDFFADFLREKHLLFFGSGSKKLTFLNNQKNVSFSDYNYTTKDVALLTYKKLSSFRFTNLAYSEPFYLKDFYFHQKNG
jgi:tRNA threonylcarbamoyladenosine biosynthesis protein TsaB